MGLKCTKCGHEFNINEVVGSDITCVCGFKTTTEYLIGFRDGVNSVNKTLEPYYITDDAVETTIIQTNRTTDSLGKPLPKWSTSVTDGWEMFYE